MTQHPTASDTEVPREITMMMAHHDELQAHLRERTGALTTAAEAGGDTGEARTALHDFLAGEVIPHALAEEDAIYSAGSAIDTLAPLVAGMIMEHHTLVELAGQVEHGGTSIGAAAAATAFGALFDVHVRKENELLLPGLIAAGTDPAELLSTMHRAFAARRDEAAVHIATDLDTAGLLARDGEQVVDTRMHAAGSCANLANDAADALGPGGSFLLVADHDPRGIRYMLDAERPGRTTWQLLEDGPQRWQARITSAAIEAAHAGRSRG